MIKVRLLLISLLLSVSALTYAQSEYGVCDRNDEGWACFFFQSAESGRLQGFETLYGVKGGCDSIV